ncbi:MAG: hypothetical protein KAH56_00425 [Candidatus Krumholzibacteria bacterium]|nr:hypothetical protein [Candidatus Krumholzibacteria bacterium]
MTSMRAEPGWEGDSFGKGYMFRGHMVGGKVAPVNVGGLETGKEGPGLTPGAKGTTT